jgi:hypothetical protein
VNRKLVVFVPPDALEAVREAVFAAGAGRIGDYERCSWYTEGTGTFLGGEGTDPTIGERGREERVPELRLETVYPIGREAEVVRALREAHPYEEPAFDLYPLA